ncbi:conserved hypothetical protein [Candidatus Accumulibacter aalborgensis]|uniref:CRISPR-associated protein Cas5 family n=2 Tax=Candidatus Accumulibacter aalborgensis TaxID=1860102 RepID=A0A1A8XV91_9PROT|nr:conserved hypothetical protein [Candidatus Accumulibacter aalborgensis]
MMAMDFLIFQLQAPLASWGDTAVGEYRPSIDYPGQSALVGLLGAALGLRREEEAAHAALAASYGFAVGIQSGGHLLRDYHTAQVPGQTALKKRPHATRRDELAVPKSDLHTILSTRDYRQDAASLVAVQAFDGAPRTLAELAEALQKPHFVLYLGRKSCPPAAPLHPLVLAADSALSAMEAYRAQIEAERRKHLDRKGRPPLEELAPIRKLAWSEGVAAGANIHLSTRRKDRLIRRRSWQFGDRIEHIALLAEES